MLAAIQRIDTTWGIDATTTTNNNNDDDDDDKD